MSVQVNILNKISSLLSSLLNSLLKCSYDELLTFKFLPCPDAEK